MQKWFTSFVQYLFTSIWDLKYTFSNKHKCENYYTTHLLGRGALIFFFFFFFLVGSATQLQVDKISFTGTDLSPKNMRDYNVDNWNLISNPQ